jgi:hypothetical protein
MVQASVQFYPTLNKKTQKNWNLYNFYNFEGTSLKKIKCVRERFPRVFAKNFLFLHKGMGDMGEIPEVSQVGPVSPTTT